MTPLVLVASLAFFFQGTPSYTVAGTLVDGVTGAPISKARVSLSGVAAPFITGADGAFRFDKLKTGKYVLKAERLGYVTQTYAQRALMANLSTGIVTGEHESTTSLVFRMIPGAVIAGLVRDASGEPVAGMDVRVVRIFGTGKTRHTGAVTPASTDDRGYYRVRSLAEGSYAVIAAGHPRQEIPSVEPMAYPVTFYPGTTDPSAAAFVRVRPGEEAPANITLHAVPTVRVEGEVPSAIGVNLNLYVGIMAPSLFGTRIPIGESAFAFNGKFTFQSVPAGNYHLLLVRGAGDARAAQVLGVADLDAATNPARISITEAPPLRISIHLSVAGKPRVPSSRVLASLVPLDMVGTDVATIGPDGRGVFPGYPAAGRYTILATQGRALAVTSLKVTGAPQSGLVFDVPETGSVEIEAVADASTVDVSGRVLRDTKPASGILVLLVQRSTWQQIGIYRSDQSDSDGTFAWRDLPPGEYLAFALEHGMPEDYDDAESLRTLLPIAQPLTLTDAPSQSVELKLLPLPAAN